LRIPASRIALAGQAVVAGLPHDLGDVVGNLTREADLHLMRQDPAIDEFLGRGLHLPDVSGQRDRSDDASNPHPDDLL